MNDIGLVAFIEGLKENRCLWDPNDVSYGNKTVRKSAQLALLNIAQKYVPNASINSVRKKIDYLRSMYLRERKKVEASEFEPCSMSNKVYTPTLWYYNHLNFLSEAYRNRTVPDFPDSFVQSFLQDDEDERQEIRHQPRDDVTDFRTPPLNAQKRKHFSVQKQLMTSSEILTNVPETGLKDNWEAFGLSVGGDLRNLEKKQQTIAQKLISDVIFFAKMGRLSESCAVADSPTLFVSSSPSASSIMSSKPPTCNITRAFSPSEHSFYKENEPEMENCSSDDQISTDDTSDQKI